MPSTGGSGRPPAAKRSDGFRIVGVVDDVHHISLSRDPVPEMYHPIAQSAPSTFTVVLRTAGEPSALGIRSASECDCGRSESADLRSAHDDRPNRGVADADSSTMLVLMVTAMLAASLAAVAIYGSIWYTVVQRQKELGIRMALGASRGTVFRSVVGGAVARASAGAVVGAAAAMAGGSLLRTMLYDTRTTDPLTYVAVTALVLAVAVAASLVPATRAMSVDPMSALRNE